MVTDIELSVISTTKSLITTTQSMLLANEQLRLPSVAKLDAVTPNYQP
ncbi:hypothetical protein [Shewanella japonica]|nr:hypothetical protein [Shewanella japonica]